MPDSASRTAPTDVVEAGIDNAVNPFVKRGVAYWRLLRGQRRFPARGDLSLRGSAPILPHAAIISVIDEGADFEYRFIGEEQRQAFKFGFKGLRVSQVVSVAPLLGRVLHDTYGQVLCGEPFLIQGRVSHVPAEERMLFHETAFLPLGVSDATVDHILIVGVQLPEPFWSVPVGTFDEIAEPIPSEASAMAR